jgi:hypothetical protein
MEVTMAEEEKLVSKSGTNGVASAIMGALLVLAPGLFEGVPREQLLDVIGSAMIVFGFLAALFRRISDGKRPKIV